MRHAPGDSGRSHPPLQLAKKTPVKAVVFRAPFDLAVDNVPDPTIEAASDAVIRITTANICGSDRHPYEDRAPLDAGMVLGHENMGVVEEVGPGVNRVSVGGRVSVPFNLACGTRVDGRAQRDVARCRLAGRALRGHGRELLSGRPRPGDHGRDGRLRCRLRRGSGRVPGPRRQRRGAPGDGAGQPGAGRAGDRAHRVVRVYVPQDPDAGTEKAKQGRVAFN